MERFSWPSIWLTELGEERLTSLAAELRRELPEGHVLCGHSYTALAMLRRDPDWVAFELEDGRFAAVHLTWHVEHDPQWPGCEIYNSLEELCMPGNFD